MAQDSIMLPEVSVENFEHAWKRFRLSAVAKQWQEEKQLQILPTLLRGNLVDYYMDLGDDEKKSLEEVKQALERKAGIKKDPIVAAKYFNSRHQDDRERVMDYATQLHAHVWLLHRLSNYVSSYTCQEPHYSDDFTNPLKQWVELSDQV